MNVRIVKRPHGEAPEDVRDAWIGLLLPVLPCYSRVVGRRSLGVLSGPRSWLAMWFTELIGRDPRKRSYLVDTAAAVNLLENVNPVAATWWRTNAPHLFKSGRCLRFDEECCTVEDPAEAGKPSK
jgi:hypothetical protein